MRDFAGRRISYECQLCRGRLRLPFFAICEEFVRWVCVYSVEICRDVHQLEVLATGADFGLAAWTGVLRDIRPKGQGAWTLDLLVIDRLRDSNNCASSLDRTSSSLKHDLSSTLFSLQLPNTADNSTEPYCLSPLIQSSHLASTQFSIMLFAVLRTSNLQTSFSWLKVRDGRSGIRQNG